MDLRPYTLLVFAYCTLSVGIYFPLIRGACFPDPRLLPSHPRAPPRARHRRRPQPYPVMPAVPHVTPAVRDARSPPRMTPAPIAADEIESPFVVIVPQGFHNCTHARKCALQPTPPLPQLVPKASAFFWLHGRTRAAMRALRDDPGPSGREGVIDAARDLLTEFFAQRWSHKVLVIQYKRSAG